MTNRQSVLKQIGGVLGQGGLSNKRKENEVAQRNGETHCAARAAQPAQAPETAECILEVFSLEFANLYCWVSRRHRVQLVGVRAMPVPFDQLPIGDGRLPDGTTAPFFVDRRELERVREDGPTWKYEDARFIPQAVSEPDAIFRGLRRPNQVDSLCYSVFLTHDPDDEASEFGSAAAPVFGYVFLAFAYLAPMGYLVFDWEWRPTADEPGHPENWPTDFAERVWHST